MKSGIEIRRRDGKGAWEDLEVRSEVDRIWSMDILYM